MRKWILRHKRASVIIAALAVLALPTGGSGDASGTPQAHAPRDVDVHATPSAEPAPRTSASPSAPAAAVTPEPPPPTSSAPASSRWRMVSVVDGDTVDVMSGGVRERVRIIGVDTPERGECGFDEASRALADLLAGEHVHLTEGAQDDRDRYGRLLRYVDVAGTDAGLALIERGLAVARYDSRDGYGAHTREDTYVTTDARTDMSVCDAATQPETGSPGAEAGSSGRGTGSPDGEPALYANCAAARQAGAAPVYRGDPGYASHLDGDNDGVGCE